MSYKFLLIMTTCIFMIAGLNALNFYVDNHNPIGGTGSMSNPFQKISTAISHARDSLAECTIYVRGRGSSPQTNIYTTNLIISGFNYPLTITKWTVPNIQPEEILVQNIVNTASAIRVTNNNATIELNSLTITRNNILSSGYSGGGIYANNNSLLIVDECIFRNNSSRFGGGMYILDTETQISNSKFFDNTGLPSTGGLIVDSYGGAIYSDNSNVSLSYTLFRDNAGPIGSTGTLTSGTIYCTGGSLQSENCTIVQNGYEYPVQGSSFTQSYTNCIIRNPTTYNSPNYTYCCGYDTDLPELPGDGNMITDPLFTDYVDYKLKWDENVKSPCIMAGYMDLIPDRHGLNAYDRLDIGAVQFDEFPHEWVEYEYPSHSQRNGIKWMSFPSLDRISNTDQDMAYNFFDPLMQYRDVYQIKWKLYNENSERIIQYDGNDWQGDNHEIIPTQGYKLIMSPNVDEPIMQYVTGMPTAMDTPIHLQAYDSEGQRNENWVGYFKHATVSPFVAFANVINNLCFIQTQDWTMVRTNLINMEKDDYDATPMWLFGFHMDRPGTIKYGDMAVVKCYEDCEFNWRSDGPELEPYEVEQVEHFAYIEQPEYTPFFIDFEGTDLPKEVGLYIENVCMGGAKVIDKLVEVPGYLLDGMPEYPEIEFRLYYDNKANDIVPEYSVMNHSTGEYFNRPLVINDNQDYYRVKIKTGDNSTSPAAKVYISNYPNPFNPNTKIEYYVPEDSEISVDIFNVKGQKVISLCNGYQSKGMHKINWNGTSSTGKALSSGVYFASLSYKGKQITQKMIMMK